MPAAPSAPIHVTVERLEQAGARQRPRALFLGKTYAGWRTRFLNLQAHIEQDGRLDASFHAVTGWRPEGRLERMPWLPPRSGQGAVARSAPWRPSGGRDLVVGSEALLPYLCTGAAAPPPLVLESDERSP
jgi:hypothetical protein